MRATALAALVAALFAAGVRPASAANSFYVDPTGTDSAGCGASTAPCKTIQFAVDKTASGDKVLVRSGTYKECIVVVPGTGVGAIEVWAEAYSTSSTPGLSIIDGAGVCDAASGTPGPVAVVHDQSSLLGFSIKNGGDSGVWGLGAVKITANTISGNATATSGGGIFLATGAYVTDGTKKAEIKLNTIKTNVAQSDGAGIYVDASAAGLASTVEIDANTLSANTAGAGTGAYGAAITVFTDTASATDSSSVAITRNTIDGNVAKNPTAGGAVSYGGGIFVATGAVSGSGTETVTIGGAGKANSILNNVSEGFGGGISVNLQPGEGAKHTIDVAANTVSANTGKLGGGGLHAFVLADNLSTGTNALEIAGNSLIANHALGDPAVPGSRGGGGAFVEAFNYRTPADVVALDISRNEIRGNDASDFGGGVSLQALADDDPNADGATAPAVMYVRFENNLVAGNKAQNATSHNAVGGGVAVTARSIGDQALVTVDQRFLTIADNTTDQGAGGVEWNAIADPNSLLGVGSVDFELSNSILKSNDGFGVGGPILPGGTIGVRIAYNDAIDNVAGDYESQLGASTGTDGNISVDPGLDLLYIPLLCSPVIDQGDPALPAGNEPMPNGARVNIGHLGNSADASRTFPDVNGDGTIDGLDVLGIAVAFSASSADPRFIPSADRDFSGVVDGQDLAYVSAFYAQSCP